MVGSINSPATQAQQAIANPFQQQNNRQVEDQRDQDKSAAQANRTLETGKTDTKNQNVQKNTQLAANGSSSKSEGSAGRGQERGSLLDISV